jgi:hypothetical protein
MKMTKFFAAIFAFAAVAFTACEPQPQGPIVPPVDTTEQVVDLVQPTVAKPAAGQTTVVLYVPADTPKGCYAVGSFNWDATNTEKLFTAVEGAQEVIKPKRAITANTIKDFFIIVNFEVNTSINMLLFLAYRLQR